MVITVLEWSEVVLLYVSTALQHALEGESTNEFRMRPLFQVVRNGMIAISVILFR